MAKVARKKEGDKRTAKPAATRAKTAAAPKRNATRAPAPVQVEPPSVTAAAPKRKAARASEPAPAPTQGEKPGATAAAPKRKATRAPEPAQGETSGTTAAAPKRKATRAPAPAQAEPSGELNLGYLADFVGFHLRLAQDASYRVFSRHREKDLVKPGRFPALAIIQLNPGISQSALGRAIARDKSTVSPLIKDLQRNGFISRKPSAYDRRSVTLTLTKKGERTLTRLHAHAAAHEDELDRLIGPSKTRFVTVLDKIVSGMGAHD